MKVDTTYTLTYDMASEVLGEHRAEVELFQKKLTQKMQALDEAITTISEAFPHVVFDQGQSCFLYVEKVDEKREMKAREFREAAVAGRMINRMTCDCCSLL